MNEKKYLIIYAILFIAAIVGHSIPSVLPYMLKLTPFFLLAINGLALFSIREEKNLRLLGWCILFFTVSILFEILGVKTGFVFGQYIYGNTLGFKLFGVPLITALNWTLVIAGIANIFEERNMGSLEMFMIAVGVCAVFFDSILEPVAVKCGYRLWLDSIIPMHNYYSRFIISALGAMLIKLLKVKFNSGLLWKYIAMQTIYFICLRIILVPR